MLFSQGVRTVPAGSLEFVDFSKPDPGSARVQRFMVAAQHALAEGKPELAAQRLIYARDAEPVNVPVLRLMTLAFWQAGNLEAAARAVRDWARVEPDRPSAHRFAARIYEDIGAIDLAAEAAERAVDRAPEDAGEWERLGRLRLRLMDRDGAIDALQRARGWGRAWTDCSTSAWPCTWPGDVGGRGLGVRAGGRPGPGVGGGLVAAGPRAGPDGSDRRMPRGVQAGAGAGGRRRGPPAARAAPGGPVARPPAGGRGYSLVRPTGG